MNIQETAVTKVRANGTTLELETATGVIKITMSGVTDDLRKAAIEMANYGWRSFAFVKGVLYRNGVKMPSMVGVHSFSVTFTHAQPA